MSISDLLFIVLVLATIIGLLLAIRVGWRAVIALAGVWLLYLFVGVVVAVSTPQRIVPIGEDRCFDEICFAVISSQRVASPRGALYVIDLRISSHARGRPQREGGAAAVLVDSSGSYYRAIPSPGNPSLDQLLQPGQSVRTQLIAHVPASVSRPGLEIVHSYWFNPAYIIVGDDSHFLHPHAMTKLDW